MVAQLGFLRNTMEQSLLLRDFAGAKVYFVMFGH